MKSERLDRSKTVLPRLRETLAQLYPDMASIRRVVQDAGVPLEHVDLGGSAINKWHAVLIEATKRNLIEQIVRVTCAEHPEHDALKHCDALDELYRLRDERRIGKLDTTDLDREIVRIKRERRNGPQLQPGEYLADDYRLIEEIGHGGFATVWKAYSRRRDAFVAVKVLHGQYVRDATVVDRFDLGARTIARLRHPNVVRIEAPHSQDQGFHYFAMEYVDGGNLREAVLAKRVRSDAGMRIVLEVGSVLQYIHAQEIKHRDIKPENVLLRGDGSALLTDFDLALVEHSTKGTRTGTAFGTYLYTAPEALEDARQADARSDVYSLGMTTLFVVKEGTISIHFLSRRENILSALSCERSIVDVIRKATEPEPDQRFQSAREFCEALQACVKKPFAPIKASSRVPNEDRHNQELLAEVSSGPEVRPTGVVPPEEDSAQRSVTRVGVGAYKPPPLSPVPPRVGPVPRAAPKSPALPPTGAVKPPPLPPRPPLLPPGAKRASKVPLLPVPLRRPDAAPPPAATPVLTPAPDKGPMSQPAEVISDDEFETLMLDEVVASTPPPQPPLRPSVLPLASASANPLMLDDNLDELVFTLEPPEAETNKAPPIRPSENPVEEAMSSAAASELTGDLQGARTLLEQVYATNRGNDRLRGRMRALYEKLEASREVASLWMDDAEFAPDDVTRFERLRKAGEVWLDQVGDAEQAVPLLEQARALKTSDHDITVLLADAYTLTERLEEATRLLKEAIDAHKGRRSKELAVLMHRMGRVAYAAGDHQVELAWLSAALDTDMQNGQVAAELADVSMELGNYDAATKALRAVTLTKNPAPMTRAQAFLKQGMISQMQGDAKKAAFLARKALSEDPSLSDAQEFLTQLGAK